MKRLLAHLLLGCWGIAALAQTASSQQPQDYVKESRAEYDARMQWWNEARFGLFIHWGLYAIPAGTWGAQTNYGEWIRTSAQIPIGVYDNFVTQFNPVKFDADAWVRMAKDAGMKYIVITSKHHDGFCLFDSKETDFDVMATPFHRDILRELSEACRKEGIRMCWYHSIMDWHHPDYLPRREWEKDRPETGADYDRYVLYMKNQIRELLTAYGKIGVLWFDGEWESTWNRTRGLDLYRYVRGLQPDIIINNRVGAGRSGMEGFTKEGEYAGDYATPEQEIPATGFPGVYWETCMTMNDHWGYNSRDTNWKSTEDLIRKLADIASKGGNFLLNVGPTAEGTIPEASINRLKAIGAWMKVNGDAISGTSASPFQTLAWGRCTQRSEVGGTRLYLHVFQYPADGKLVVPGIFNRPQRAFLLADAAHTSLPVAREEDALVIRLPEKALDPLNTVVVLDVEGKPDVNNPPAITAESDIFVTATEVQVTSERENVQVRYTLDGTIPSQGSLLARGTIRLTESCTFTARCFREGKPVSGPVRSVFRKVTPRPAVTVEALKPGIHYAYFEGDWDSLPNFGLLKPVKDGFLPNLSFSPRREQERFGFEYTGYIRIPEDGVYLFFTESDDGSSLSIGKELVVDNDGLHGALEKKGAVALAKGLHPIRVTFFEKTGSDVLTVSLSGPGMKKQPLPDAILFTKNP